MCCGLALLACALAQVPVARAAQLRGGRARPGSSGRLFLLLFLVRRGALGAGDVKAGAALGALLGFPLILPGIAWGLIAGGAAALLLLVTRRAGRKDAIAYAPTWPWAPGSSG